MAIGVLEVLSTSIGLAYVIGVILWIRRLRQHREKLAQVRSAFVETILQCIKNKTLQGLTNLHDLYQAHFGKEMIEPGDFEELSQLIRRAILSLATSTQMSGFRDVISGLEALLAANEERLRKEKVRLPFSETPLPERQLLEDILELTSADKDLVRSKLTELAKAVKIRQETIEKLANEGHQSVVLARWGVAGTIVFSLVSILISILAMK